MIVDAQSGAVAARVDGLGDPANTLEWSSDGRSLAGTFYNDGVRMIGTSTWRAVASDRYGGNRWGAPRGLLAAEAGVGQADDTAWHLHADVAVRGRDLHW